MAWRRLRRQRVGPMVDQLHDGAHVVDQLHDGAWAARRGRRRQQRRKAKNLLENKETRNAKKKSWNLDPEHCSLELKAQSQAPRAQFLDIPEPLLFLNLNNLTVSKKRSENGMAAAAAAAGRPCGRSAP